MTWPVVTRIELTELPGVDIVNINKTINKWCTLLHGMAPRAVRLYQTLRLMGALEWSICRMQLRCNVM